jgi:hypothetical protein
METGHFCPTATAKPTNLMFSNVTQHLIGAARTGVHKKLIG